MKMTALLISALLLLLVGCSTQRGVPNHVRVNSFVERGGQPDARGWLTLKWSGVDTVIKLNTGRDYGAEALGMHVIYLPINSWDQTFGTVSTNLIDRAVHEIEQAQLEGRKVYVHCTHGQDRTGLIIGVYQYRRGMSKEAAYAEMKELGFHPTLLGLYRAWEDTRR